MHKVYDMWPDIARRSYNSNFKLVDFKNISQIVFSGMGGSGSLHDVFSAILSKTNIHVNVVKGYHLPNTVDSNTLVVTTSVSGDTVETLTVLDSAKSHNCKIIAFSSGGRMEEYCLKNNIEHRKIPMYLSPRSSFVSFLFSMLKILQSTIQIKNKDNSINNIKYFT